MPAIRECCLRWVSQLVDQIHGLINMEIPMRWIYSWEIFGRKEESSEEICFWVVIVPWRRHQGSLNDVLTSFTLRINRQMVLITHSACMPEASHQSKSAGKMNWFWESSRERWSNGRFQMDDDLSWWQSLVAEINESFRGSESAKARWSKEYWRLPPATTMNRSQKNNLLHPSLTDCNELNLPSRQFLIKIHRRKKALFFPSALFKC